MKSLFATGIIALSLPACATGPEASPMWGSFGGEHIGLTMGTVDSAVEYDCAEGVIYGPIIPRADGSFVVHGRHTPGRGGPAREDEALPSYPAVYRGKFTGVIVLEVDVEGHGTLGPFTLVRNQEPKIFRCL